MRQRFEKQMDQEMRFHLQAATEEYRRQGLSAEEAQRRALADFGSLELAKDEKRDLHPLQRLEGIRRDLVYAARQMRHSPTFALTVILTLAVAIGANTAIFSVVRAILFQPLPYVEPERLVCLWQSDRDIPWYTFSHPRFRFFQEHLLDVAQIAAYDDEAATVFQHGEAVRVEGGRVSANFFSVLGVSPALGRTFAPDEDRRGANPVAVLSDRFWRERFGADPKILGRAITVDDQPFTVIGVMPPAFQFLGVPIDVWRSRIVDTRTYAPASVELGATYLTVIARLEPGNTLGQLRERIRVLDRQYRAANPGNSDLTGRVNADGLQKKVYASVQKMVLVLWGAVACLLVIACANVANLVLARAIARLRELQIRAALGAGRSRIAQQLVIENLLLAFCSILVSLPLGVYGTQELALLLRQSSSAVPDVHADSGLMMFLFCLATSLGMLLGLLPMFLFRRASLHATDRGSSISRQSALLRNGIGSAQIAFCLILLTAAGLLADSFVRMSTTRTGIASDGVVLFPLDLMPERYRSLEQRGNFYDEAILRAASIPGVKMAAVASRIDVVANGLGYMVQPEGQVDLGPRNPSARGRSVSSDYFRVLGIPLLKGRYFDEHDTARSKRVAIVNEAFAGKFFPDLNPIGRHVKYSTDRIDCEIVGVVSDVRAGMSSAGSDEQIYLPLEQRPFLVATLLVRTTHASGVGGAIREAVRSIDRQQAVAGTVTLGQMIERRLRMPRMETTIVAVFALSALFLAAVGIYGLMAYSVAQRQKEIGIRIALGADSSGVHRLVFRQTFGILAVGFLIGVPASLALSRLYSSLLFSVRASDALALSSAGAVLVMTALAATYLPARRSAGADPISVLRID